MKTKPQVLGRWTVAMCALAGALVPISSASAGSYPPGPPDPKPAIVLDSDKVVAGSFFSVTITNCEAGTIIPVTLDGRTVNARCTNPVARARLQAPTKPGIYILMARVGTRIPTREIEVVAGNGSNFPTTGLGSLSTTLSIGTAALAAGIGLYVVAKRRSRLRLVS